MRAVERSPEHGGGLDARGAAAFHVVAGVAHEHRILSRDAKLLNRLQDRLGMWLEVLDVVTADDDVEHLVKPGDPDAAHRAIAQLAGHHAESLAGSLEPPDLVDDAVVRFHERVVVREVVGAVGLHHRLDLFLVLGDLPELRPKRRAEALDPQVVGRHRLAATVLRHRVAVGAQDQVDRVDDGAVEVEEESGEGHR